MNLYQIILKAHLKQCTFSLSNEQDKLYEAFINRNYTLSDAWDISVQILIKSIKTLYNKIA